MIISFFEEYPTKENLEKAKLINFPTKLYIAAESIEQLNKIKSQIKSKYVKEIIWWPILKKEEGYWFSPFASKKGMQRILQQINQTTMIDLEKPYNKIHYLTKVHKLLTNRKILKKIIKNKNTIPCENFSDNIIMKLLGLNYKKKNKIKMLYSSFTHFPFFIKERIIRNLSKKYPQLKIGLGIIAPGEEIIKVSILAPEQLKQDLELCKKNNIKEVIIFRLGGLNKNYLKIINRI